MAEARVQLTVEIETEGAEQLTALRRQLEALGDAGQEAFAGLDASLGDVVSTLAESRALVAAATNDFLASNRRLFSSLTPLFDTFFARVLAGAVNFRDVFKRLLADLLDFFLRMVERMVAGWLAGFRQMSLGLPAGAGSPFAVLLGGLFGGPTASGAGGLLGALAPSLSGGLGFLIGPGGTAPTFPGGGGLSATNLGLLSRLGIDLHSLGPVSGGLLASGGLLGTLLGFRQGSPTLGALSGAAAGFAFGGPIGALIGGIVGLFAGLFGRGKNKRKAAAITEQGLQAMQEVVDQFKQFQLTFDQATQAINSIYGQMKDAWRQIPGQFDRSVRNAQPFVDRYLKEIQDLQKERDRRAALIAALPLPEFAVGGFVDDVRALTASNGRILAFLHQGEAVLNARAVQTLGRGFIEQANRAPGFQAGGFATLSPAAPAAGARSITVNVSVHAAPGMDARALADFTIRRLQRTLADRGESL